jgi:peptide/nickel transport system substrate-binding protein
VHSKGYGIMLSAWSADYPTGSGFFSTLIDGRQIHPSGNNNYAELDDPLINEQLDQVTTVTDGTRAAGIWQQVNAEVMDNASMLPLTYDQVLNYRNPRLTNVFVNQFYGTWDVTAMGTV